MAERRYPDPLTTAHASLPAVVEQLLVEVAADGFTLHCCGPKAAPNALVATYEWDRHVDLLHPAHPEAPATCYPAPASLHVPRAQQRPMTIRPPSPSRATVRAIRLAAECLTTASSATDR